MIEKEWKKLYEVFNSKTIAQNITRPCPKITYKKWWHRFIPKYRKFIKIMNIKLQHDWDNGMREEVDKRVMDMFLYGNTTVSHK